MVVEAIEYSRFGNEEDLDLLQIDSTALGCKSSESRSSCCWF